MQSAHRLAQQIIWQQLDMLHKKSKSGVRLDTEEISAVATLVAAEAKIRTMPVAKLPRGRPSNASRWDLPEEKLLDYAESEAESGS